MVSSYNREEDAVTHMAVNACLAPLCSVDGMAVTTVEGIGSSHTTLHPVQVTPAIIAIFNLNSPSSMYLHVSTYFAIA